MIGHHAADERLLDFTVTEGTWMSLDVSPDGREIVFDLLGHLYLLPIAGGWAKQITHGSALHRQPRFSPDGRFLTYVSDEGGGPNIWIANSDGRDAYQLSALSGYPYGAVTSPTWSPDGGVVVAAQMIGAARTGRVPPSLHDRWLLAAYDVGRKQMRWISDTSSPSPASVLGPAFLPEGKALYASVQDMVPGLWKLARIDLATGRIQSEMWNLLPRGGMRPAVSPDGRYVIYGTSSGSRFGLRVRDRRSDAERWLIQEAIDAPTLLPAQEAGDLLPGYAFTPDSRSLVVSYDGRLHRIEIASGASAMIPFRARISRALTPPVPFSHPIADTGLQTHSISHPALSPDGRRVVFSALDRLWVMNLETDGRHSPTPYRLTEDSTGEFYPSWAPDGQWIAYSTWKDGEGGAVRRVATADSSRAPYGRSQRLTSDTGMYFHTAVTPDGKSVVAARVLGEADLDGARTGGYPEVALVRLRTTGGASQVIASLRGTIAEQPDHQEWYRYPIDQIYFTDDTSRIYVGLTSWGLSSGDRLEVVSTRGVEDLWPHSATGVLSPDRAKALVVGRYTLFQVDLRPLGTGATDTVDLRYPRLATKTGTTNVTRWGTALAPWLSWSQDGSRVAFAQGGTLFVGDARSAPHVMFQRVDVALAIPTQVHTGVLVLRGAQLITMRPGEVIKRGTMVVNGGRIAAVGREDEITIPKEAYVLDLDGRTILPGYVDVHDHMVLPKGLHPTQAWQCLVRLAYGVTASRDPQPDLGVDVFTYRDRERAGTLVCPRVFSTGLAYKRAAPLIEAPDDAAEWVRPNAEYFGSEALKVHHDPLAGRTTRQLLVAAARLARINTVLHSQGLEFSLSGVIDGFGGVDHTPMVRLYEDVIKFFAGSRTIYTQTYGAVPGFYNYMARRHGHLCEAPKVRHFLPPGAKNFWCNRYTRDSWFGTPTLDDVTAIVTGAARIVAKGGRVAIGSHVEMPGLGFHYEMWLHALGGMQTHDILAAATLVGATAIGHARDIGSLEVGKLADLQVLDCNPLADIHNTLSLRYVVKNGVLYAADDLTRLWPQRPSGHSWKPSSLYMGRCVRHHDH
jgi:WD40 repeat protein